MFKNQPKGLYALALSNTGERFGYYTMLAIFVLFLQAKFGFDAKQAGGIYSTFLAVVYFMPFVGGILADKFGYGKMVTLGIAVMFLGYFCLVLPVESNSLALWVLYGALFLVALGTGLFKGNLQVLVGNLYDGPEYRSKRDSAFSLFYMAINLGAMYAPSAATAVTNFFLKKQGLFYDANIPSLAHQYLQQTITPENADKLAQLAHQQGQVTTDLGAFAQQYIDALSGSYSYGFGVACISLIVSVLIYKVFRNTYKHADVTASKVDRNASLAAEELTPKQVRSRVITLSLVFFVVIFFWMSFHQNGLTMTFFARDYTAKIAQGFTRFGFDVLNLTMVWIAIYVGIHIFQANSLRGRLTAGGLFGALAVGIVVRYLKMPETIDIAPQIFQQFNPFFVVVLTPISIGLFNLLSRLGREPSTPRKIGWGMLIAACGFLILTVGSLGLMSPSALDGNVSETLVSPNYLISTYLVLTFAELLLSPMGISFVTKVAPPKLKGMMMGGWFAATGIGNWLCKTISDIWGSGMELWQVWLVLISVCLLSALFIFAIMKRLESAIK
jgi:POT family proton-dependent oligopeptide transporter